LHRCSFLGVAPQDMCIEHLCTFKFPKVPSSRHWTACGTSQGLFGREGSFVDGWVPLKVFPWVFCGDMTENEGPICKNVSSPALNRCSTHVMSSDPPDVCFQFYFQSWLQIKWPSLKREQIFTRAGCTRNLLI
jgi:hypothetical protein